MGAYNLKVAYKFKEALNSSFSNEGFLLEFQVIMHDSSISKYSTTYCIIYVNDYGCLIFVK